MIEITVADECAAEAERTYRQRDSPKTFMARTFHRTTIVRTKICPTRNSSPEVNWRNIHSAECSFD